jgi:hypothetical protein
MFVGDEEADALIFAQVAKPNLQKEVHHIGKHTHVLTGA